MKTNFLKLFLSVAVCLTAGFVGSIFTAPHIVNWYAGLNKPSFSPPNWVFGPVWTILFILMGVSFYIVWQKGLKTKTALAFATQLILNVAWSLIFFGLHLPGWAFFELIALWLAILWTIMSFRRVSKLSAYLLLPYILWVSFAGALNLAIWLLNM